MAIPNIPLNLSTMPMTTIADSLRKVKEEQMADRLSQATIGEKEASAQKTQMLSNILGQYMGGAGGGGIGAGQGMQGGGSDMGQAFVRKLLGLPTELPGEQQSRELDTFAQKEQMRREMERGEGETLAPPTKAKLQDVSYSYDQLIPGLKTLIDLTPSKANPFRADWDRQKNLIVDQFITAQKLGANVPTLNTVKEILDRGKFESTESYKKAINRLIKEMTDQNKHVKSMLKAGKLIPYSPGGEDDNAVMSRALQQNRPRSSYANDYSREELERLAEENPELFSSLQWREE